MTTNSIGWRTALSALLLYVACGRATDEGEGDAEETSGEVDSTGDVAHDELDDEDPAVDLVGVDSADQGSPEVVEDLPAEGGAADDDAAGDMGEPDAEAGSEPWTPPHPTWEEVCGRRTWPEECACDRSELRSCCVREDVFACSDQWEHVDDAYCSSPEYADIPGCPPPPCSETAPFPCECDGTDDRDTYCCFDSGDGGMVFQCADDIQQWVSQADQGDVARCDHPRWDSFQPLPACPQP